MTETHPTTPASSPLDTLKALVLRNIDALEHLLGAHLPSIVSDDTVDYLDQLLQQQYRALAEHMPVGRDERLGELRHLPSEAYRYDDGSPIVVQLTSPPNVVSKYFPRYDGNREEFVALHRVAAAQVAANIAEAEAPAMVTALDEWREHGEHVDPLMDAETAAGAQTLIERLNALGPGATVGDLFKAQQNAAGDENGGAE